MKKILTILTVALLACSTVFAAVNFSGELVTGYNLNFDKDGNFSGHVFGQDGTDTNTTKLNLGIADDNGVWSVGIEGILVADGRVSGDVSIDMMKLFGADSDLSVKLGLAANDEQTVLRAYANPSGKNQDRIRTGASGVWANLSVGYADFVTVNVAGSPKTAAVADGGDLIPSLKTAQCKNQIVVHKPEPIPSNNDRPNKTEAFRSCVPAEIYQHTLKTNPAPRELQHLTAPVPSPDSFAGYKHPPHDNADRSAHKRNRLYLKPNRAPNQQPHHSPSNPIKPLNKSKLFFSCVTYSIQQLTD